MNYTNFLREYRGGSEINNIAVTTSKDSPEQIHYGKIIAQELAINFIERKKQSISKLLSRYHLESIIIVENQRLVVKTMDSELFFHPSMSLLRIKAMKQGNEDHMAKAMDISIGDKILDCTAGLATDSLVAAFAVGEIGEITGLEVSPIIYTVTKWGLENYAIENKIFNEIKTRIMLYNQSYKTFLKTLPDNSYDIVYFDPMFRSPNPNSSSINPLRAYADYDTLDIQDIVEAKRVAKKRVVVKERSFSKEFSRLGIDQFKGGKYSPIIYGFIEKV